ncbi:hypothetical protein OAA91_01210 [Fibrobacterales bacterium]|nr:hypothetical protein [Fibrobacterales bacterium]
MYALSEISLLCEKVLATGAKKWMVISVEDGDGKTLLCSQISQCLNKNLGKEVLYIDANYRNPYDENQSKFPIKYASVSKLDLNNLSSYNRELEQDLSRDIETISLIDTSPVMIYNRNNIHPMSLKEQIDGAILVVNSNSTKKRDVETVIKMLSQKQIPLLAMILNEFNKEISDKASSVTHIRYVLKWLQNIYFQKLNAKSFMKKIKKPLTKLFSFFKIGDK